MFGALLQYSQFHYFREYSWNNYVSIVLWDWRIFSFFSEEVLRYHKKDLGNTPYLTHTVSISLRYCERLVFIANLRCSKETPSQPGAAPNFNFFKYLIIFSTLNRYSDITVFSMSLHFRDTSISAFLMVSALPLSFFENSSL